MSTILDSPAPCAPAPNAGGNPAAVANTASRYVALDFETADYGRDSACALSVVIVENDAVKETWTTLLRPPRKDFVFSYLHGIEWAHVRDKPTFAEAWKVMASKLAGARFVAAHNASFDRSVLDACCTAAGIPPLDLSFLCTVRAARKVWGYYPTTLSHVCRQLQIPLRHHDAESDALACARILLAARQHGREYDELLQLCRLKPPRRGQDRRGA